MKIEMNGVVTQGDSYRVDDGHQQGSVWIGDRDVVEEFDDADMKKNVKVSLNGKALFVGDLYFEMGWGYSEYTPMDSDVVKIGDVDLLAELEKYVGKSVSLVIEDV